MRVAAVDCSATIRGDDGLDPADLIPLQIAFVKLAVQQTLYGDFMHHRLKASRRWFLQRAVRDLSPSRR